MIAYNKIEIHKVPSTLMKMTQRSEHITCICKHEDENKNEEDLLSDRTWWNKHEWQRYHIAYNKIERHKVTST